MPTKRANGVGRIIVEFEVANYGDLILAQYGTLPPDQVRRETIQGLVDPRVMKLVLPQSVVKRLGLPMGDPILVHYADGRRVQRRVADGVFLKLLGRDDTFTAIIEPRRRYALIGRIVLQEIGRAHV